MSSLFLVLAAAVLVSVVALPSKDVPKEVHDACKHIEETNICYSHCIDEKAGVLDKDGLYLEAGAAKLLAFQNSVGLSPEQINNIAKACNSLNENPVAGCERANQVYECIDNERSKITGIKHI